MIYLRVCTICPKIHLQVRITFFLLKVTFQWSFFLSIFSFFLFYINLIKKIFNYFLMNEITFSVLKFELFMRMSRSVGDRILTPMFYIFFPGAWVNTLLWGYSLGCVLSLCVLSGAWALGPATSSSSVSVLVSGPGCSFSMFVHVAFVKFPCHVLLSVWCVFILFFWSRLMVVHLPHALVLSCLASAHGFYYVCFYMLCALQSNVLTPPPSCYLVISPFAPSALLISSP